jgi:hypothetical protein
VRDSENLCFRFIENVYSPLREPKIIHVALFRGVSLPNLVRISNGSRRIHWSFFFYGMWYFKTGSLAKRRLFTTR